MDWAVLGIDRRVVSAKLFNTKIGSDGSEGKECPTKFPESGRVAKFIKLRQFWC